MDSTQTSRDLLFAVAHRIADRFDTPAQFSATAANYFAPEMKGTPANDADRLFGQIFAAANRHSVFFEAANINDSVRYPGREEALYHKAELQLSLFGASVDELTAACRGGSPDLSVIKTLDSLKPGAGSVASPAINLGHVIEMVHKPGPSRHQP